MNLCPVWYFAGLAAVSTLIFSGHANAIDDVFLIYSPAFASGGQMPPRFARTHDNNSPPLVISNTCSGILNIISKPNSIESFVLIMDDPDAPGGLFTHWLVWNIAAQPQSIPEGQPPIGAVQGRNSFGDVHYDGPAPPNGKHRYFFHLYALNTVLSLPAGSDRDALEAAMRGHIVSRAPKFYGTFATGQ